MMNHNAVLFATDLSARCDRPFDRALMLAQDWKVKLILLHVIDPETVKNPSFNLHDIEAKIAGQLPETRVNIEILVKRGDIAANIIKTAQSEKCDVIVTGVARYNSISDILLGGPVDQLIRNAPVPVLIVKRKPRHAYKNIVIATDFSDCSLQALTTAAELFPEPGLHLVHAYHEPYSAWLGSDQFVKDVKSEEQKELARFLAKPLIADPVFDRLNASIEKGDLAAVLFRKIGATQSDLVVMGTHGRGALSRATLGSNAQHVLGWVDEDVLIVRERK
ncbi:universal stress protein [Parasphingorhabdus sp.]|uniref:universal stress protein n=1 Tax=Parasphingorhabdus sp. TaxID=2709688 RepID=UPI003A90856E